MNRWLAIIALACAGLTAAGAITLYLAYGIGGSFPRAAELAGLEAEAVISWHPEGYASIGAKGDLERYASLGFVHGLRNTWSAVLWRQTGMGRLGEWFGPTAVPIDRFTHSLGLASGAQVAYSRLPDDERNVLIAYASGMNAALNTRSSELGRELSLLNIEPEAWEPWHALVIERLLAWISVPASSLEVPDAAPDAVHLFVEADRKLRTFLHLHGFEESAAWSVQDSSGTTLVQRHVLGSSALPVFSEILFVKGDSLLLEGASIPGTPFFPAGKTPEVAWAVLMHGRAAWTTVPAMHHRVDTAYSRIKLRHGDELLERTPRTANSLVFLAATSPPAPPDTSEAAQPALVPVDSLWMLSWPGLASTSDATAWHSLRQNAPASFSLFDGNGLLLHREGQASFLGQARVSRATSAGLFAGNSAWSEFLARSLDSLATSDERTRSRSPYVDDCVSTWAGSVAPGLLSGAVQGFRHARVMDEALTYLRNWDYSYDRTSIGASLFDTWMRTHLDSTGALPAVARSDTAYVARRALYASLVHAINLLAGRHGNDMSEWRWEVVAPRRRYYPVWSADSLPQVMRSVLPETRYAPVETAAQGHPSTLCWGPSPVSKTIPAPDHWEAWITTSNWHATAIRRSRLNDDAFLARYRRSLEQPAFFVTSFRAQSPRETRLVPEEK